MKKKIYKTKRNPYIIEGIQINKTLLKKYLHKEGVKRITMLNDLSQISIRTETEILKVLEQMIKSKNYFKYCSSILINLNPGPNNILNYLNLKKWSSSFSSKKLNIEDKQPHLYTFLQYVYETMIKENKDQVVNLLGPIGSGKTFNLIHTMEFFTNMYGPKNYKNELFELIHKSVQLIHIFGSIYRENNIESTSCGIVIKLGFNQNNIISNFDIEAQILDLSLPFTETGRTFSIFHAFIKGANEELKKKLKIPEDDKYLSFFSKYLSNFSEKVREKLTFNDLETWNKFYSLSKFFKFSNDEILDILKCLSIILNLNELTISKVQITRDLNNDEEEQEQEEEKEEQKEIIEYYEIQKCKILKKVCKNLGLKTKEFLNKVGKFKSLNEAKNFIISFMKQTYYIVFDFILNKMRESINLYFNQLNQKIGTNNFKRNKIIYFIDFPGEVENQNLGGFTTNICNECLNMYAATGFYEIAEKLIKENIYLNKFYPIQSYFVVSSCMEKDGILENLSKPLNKQNFNSLMNNSLSKHNFINCIKFQKSKLFEEKNFNFTFTFSHKKIEYNLEKLISESRNLFKNDKLLKIFSIAQNYVINSTYKNIIINKSKDIYSTITSILCKIFKPIKDIKPFNILYLHSYNSYKIFFKNNDIEKQDDPNIEKTNKNLKDPKRNNNKNINNSYEEENIPKDITLNILKNSFIIPILYWNWQGYKEWISIDEFIKEYSYDFEKIKDRIIQINNTDPDRIKFDSNKLINFNDLPKEEVVKCTLGVLSKESEYLIGKEYILMKTGTLQRMRFYLNNMIDSAEKMNIDLKEKIRKSNNKNIYLRRKSSTLNEKALNQIESSINSTKRNSFINEKKSDDIKFKYEQNPLPKKKQFKKLEEDYSRRYLLKEQCIVNIISEGKIINEDEKRAIMKGKYFNLYYLISRKENSISDKSEEQKDKIYLEDLQINQKENELINGNNDRIYLKDRNSFNKNKLLKKDKNEKNIEHIIKIQSLIRKMISKNKYIILKYIYSQIILIQKTFRGFLIKKKFKKFLNCLSKIKLIQRIYHQRHILKVKNVTKIQEFYIRKLTKKKLKEKIIAKKKAEAKGEYYNFEIEPYEEFTHNNFNLENALRIIRVQNNKDKLTKQLISEKDPKKIVDILLYGANGRKKNLTRAQRLGIDIKIEDKLINQGVIMNERKQILARKYEDKFKEANKFVPNITQGKPNFNLEPTKKIEFCKIFKDNNLRKPKEEDIKNIESEKVIYDEKKHDHYLNNIFDRLYNEKLQIEQRKKMREEYLEKNSKAKDNKNINQNNRMSLKEILLSDELKELYKNNSPETINNNNEIWPKDIKNIYLDRFLNEKEIKTLSTIKNSEVYNLEENKNEFFE